MQYRILDIPDSIASIVRDQEVSDRYSHPTHTDVDSGYGPCRSGLRTFEERIDRRILFTHDPFAGLEDLALPEPVFIHEQPCERHDEAAKLPEDLREIPLTVNAYACGRRWRTQNYGRGDNRTPLEGVATA